MNVGVCIQYTLLYMYREITFNLLHFPQSGSSKHVVEVADLNINLILQIVKLIIRISGEVSVCVRVCVCVCVHAINLFDFSNSFRTLLFKYHIKHLTLKLNFIVTKINM